jgi:hypothetical protein
MKIITLALATSLAFQSNLVTAEEQRDLIDISSVTAGEPEAAEWAFAHLIYKTGVLTLPALMTASVCARVAENYIANASRYHYHRSTCTNVVTGDVRFWTE